MGPLPRLDPGPNDATAIVSGSSDNMGLGSDDLNTNALFTHNQKLAIQWVSIMASSISVVTCLISLYWFTVMQRNFRRTLILMLLVSDLFKSIWYLIFPSVSIGIGGVKSYSPFCNAGGFLLQAGVESCDVAILMMSLHMSLQIFNSTSPRFGGDGLYRVRYIVYAVWIILPAFMAALAFVNNRGAYLSQGAFCSLPIRPFWYRLALSWIPRYLVWAYIFWIAIRIYTKVGNGFTVFARKVDSSSNPTDNSLPSITTDKRGPGTVDFEPNPVELVAAQPPLFANAAPFGTDEPPQDRRVSDQTTMCGASSPGTSSHNPSTSTPEPAHNLVRIVSAEEKTARSRQRAILRQTRLLFIYPVAYIILMILPFVQHCFNYSDHYAQHPIFVITLLSSVCYAIMGAVDALIFCWREKPWRAIPGKDGTVLGSLAFWRMGEQTRRRGSVGGRNNTARFFRGMKSDRNALDAEYAAERLAMERAEAANRLSSHVGGGEARREWFDRKQSCLEALEESGSSASSSPRQGGEDVEAGLRTVEEEPE